MRIRIALAFAAAAPCLATMAVMVQAAQDTGVQVASSRAMRLAIIDDGSRGPVVDQMHQAFSDSLAFEVSQRCKAPVPMKQSTPDAQKASFGLTNGVYDAVIVVGAKLPATMVHSDCRILKATPISGDPKRVLWMIIRADDPGLTAMLEAAFPGTLKEAFFQKALARYSGKSGSYEIASEWRVARMGGATSGQP